MTIVLHCMLQLTYEIKANCQMLYFREVVEVVVEVCLFNLNFSIS